MSRFWMKIAVVTFIVLLSFTAATTSWASCIEDSQFGYKSKLANCPGDIKAFFGRVEDCQTLAGEADGGDNKELDAQMTKLACDRLGCDYETLLRQYDAEPEKSAELKSYVETANAAEGDAVFMSCNKNGAQ